MIQEPNFSNSLGIITVEPRISPMAPPKLQNKFKNKYAGHWPLDFFKRNLVKRNVYIQEI